MSHHPEHEYCYVIYCFTRLPRHRKAEISIGMFVLINVSFLHVLYFYFVLPTNANNANANALAANWLII